MSLKIPKLAAIHDLSCFGRCSLSVIMPVISVLGVQVCPLPTAILSSHLSGYDDISIFDFTENMENLSRSWQTEKINFDCIYSGFLGSANQINIVEKFINQFSADNKPLIVIDPVLGDHGKLYSSFDSEFVEKMKTLITKADIITPNYTEACFLLGENYNEKIDTTAEIQNWLLHLAEFGPNIVVITGVNIAGNKIANIAYEKSTNMFCEIINEKVPVNYPGTGDIFASILTGFLLNNETLPWAIDKASRFIHAAAQITYEAKTPIREGVLLEGILSELCL